MPTRCLPEDIEVIPWSDVNSGLKRQAIESDNRSRWIPEGLHFNLYQTDTCPQTSFAMLYRKHLVGWFLTHKIRDNWLRFTCWFVRDNPPVRGLRRGIDIRLAADVVRSMFDAGYEIGTWAVAKELVEWRRLIDKRVTPWADFVGETRYSSKVLG